MIKGAGLRDQRIKIYEPQEIGLDGNPHTVWKFLYERWGRVDRITSRQTIANQPQNAQHYLSPGKATFDMYVSVPENGLLVAGDKAYFVRGVVAVRQQAQINVDVEEVSDAAFVELDFASEVEPYDPYGMQLYSIG